MLSFLSYIPYNSQEQVIYNPSVNHHCLNRINTNFEELKRHLTTLIDSSEPIVLTVPFQAVFFDEATTRVPKNIAVDVPSIDPLSNNKRNKPFRFCTSSEETFTRTFTKQQKQSFPSFIDRKQQKLFLGLIDGLHRATIFFDMLRSDWKKYSSIFMKIECTVLCYSLKQDYHSEPSDEHLQDLRNFSKLISENNTKTIGHTITDGFMSCINKLLSNKGTSTYNLFVSFHFLYPKAL